MSGPFPGMDPYLEAPERWRNVHARLITYTADALTPQLLPRYAAFIEDRVKLVEENGHRIPDVALHEQPVPAGRAAAAVRPLAIEVTRPERVEAPELFASARFVAVRHLKDESLVTAIEVLSPWNKSGPGLAEYRRKQREYLYGPANLVEIDLLRRGRHTVAAARERTSRSDYRTCTHRAWSDRFEVLPFSVREHLPVVGIPLQGDDPDVVLDLPAVIRQVYDLGGFGYVLDYSREPDPPLRAEDREWARGRIAAWLSSRQSL